MNNEEEKTDGVKKGKIMSEVWTFFRIMNVRLRFIFLMVVVGLIAGHWDTLMNYYDRWQRPIQVTQTVQNQGVEYFCPMHPNIIRSEPGTCPICGMPLSKREKTGETQLPEGVLAQVQLTPLKVQMGRISTTPVDYKLLSREIRTVGILEYDETKRAFISSRVKGRIDELMVNYEGQQINKGDPLVSIYSPDLVVAQEELLSAVRSLKQQQQASDLLRSQTEFLVTAARKKLSLLGITDQQVDQIIRRGSPDTHLIVYSPISGIVTEKNVLVGQYVDEGMRIYTIADLNTVWMQAKIFEDQIAGIAKGTAVEVTSTGYPNEIFAGRITFVAYTVAPATRTISARVEITNSDYKLKPGMYANAVIRIPVGAVTPVSTVVTENEKYAVGYYCPIYPDQLFEKPRHCPIDKFPIKLMRVEKVLAVPESAVIDTGTRKVVYRQTVPGIFDMVEVRVGLRAGQFYPVLSGLKPQDQVATVGAFLVDAENRLNPAASVQYFGASGGQQSGGHQH
ncbi:MAG: efflux RND transporter periplasmic adaptor subunit [Phycisphaerae bacterium]